MAKDPSTSLRSRITFAALLFLTTITAYAQRTITVKTTVTTITVTAAPTIPSTDPELTDEDTFKSAILNSTNTYRRQHNASTVTWNETLVSYADNYLSKVKNYCTFAHSHGPFGENLALGCSDATSCIEMWGDERDLYDFRRPQFRNETGHFTQLVWKSTTDVGCGKMQCNDHRWYLACEYWPPGNMGDAYGDQVGELVGSATAAPDDVCEDSF